MNMVRIRQIMEVRKALKAPPLLPPKVRGLIKRKFCFTKDFSSKNCAAFGFGAKIPPLYRDSQQFCLNFDTDPHCTGTNGVIEAFRQAYITVQPVPNAHFSHIIYHVSKLAENTRKRNQASLPQYFVLIIITPGSVDDLRETIQAIIFASKAPLSIVFVGIGNNDFSEIEKLGFSGSRLAYQGRKVERDMLQFISLAEIYNDQEEEDIRELIAEKALSQIPRQMSTWMMKNGYSAEGKKVRT
ncbi:unnamed protein product [Dracunculus medinensis]|uniref:Copine domain-containing protein n=1 Tax=Dracunculus medinensis TaxID=318479 RepID=A0A158Q4S3_DRAME|nr:unnamed protein product [Dracunculus medinensis]